MKTPTWAIVIGICLMLIGGISLIGSFNDINMPYYLEMPQYEPGDMNDSLSTDATE